MDTYLSFFYTENVCKESLGCRKLWIQKKFKIEKKSINSVMKRVHISRTLSVPWWCGSCKACVKAGDSPAHGLLAELITNEPARSAGRRPHLGIWWICENSRNDDFSPCPATYCPCPPASNSSLTVYPAVFHSFLPNSFILSFTYSVVAFQLDSGDHFD